MSTATKRALYGKLSGDSTLTNMLASAPGSYSKAIYYQVAPEGAGFPYVLFWQSADTPTWALRNGGTAAFEEEIWVIKGVDRRSGTADTADHAEAIKNRVKALLNDGTISVSGATPRYLRYESGIDFAEVVDGVTYRHSGADFRLIVEP